MVEKHDPVALFFPCCQSQPTWGPARLPPRRIGGEKEAVRAAWTRHRFFEKSVILQRYRAAVVRNGAHLSPIF